MNTQILPASPLSTVQQSAQTAPHGRRAAYVQPSQGESMLLLLWLWC